MVGTHATKLVNPYQTSISLTSTAVPNQLIQFPQNGWVDIKEAFKSADEVPKFSHAHIVTYFVTRQVSDGLPATDFKSLNSNAEFLYRCGHVQSIQVVHSSTQLFLKASCLPEMRKDRVYSLHLILDSPQSACDIVYAVCGCPAGAGPTGSCKHISALCYAVSEFCYLGSMPELRTCTEKLQQWNKPRSTKVDPIPVEDLQTRRRQLLTSDVEGLGKQYIRKSTIKFDT